MKNRIISIALSAMIAIVFIPCLAFANEGDSPEKTFSNFKITKITVKATNSGNKVSWKAKTGDSVFDGYAVFRSTKKSSGFKKITDDISCKKFSFNDSVSLKKGKTYYYKVTGWYGSDEDFTTAKYSSVKKAKAKITTDKDGRTSTTVKKYTMKKGRKTISNKVFKSKAALELVLNGKESGQQPEIHFENCKFAGKGKDYTSVFVYGSYNNVYFNNCEFAADIVNRGGLGAKIYIQECNLENAGCVVENVKELKNLDVNSPLPRFLLYQDANCLLPEDSSGSFFSEEKNINVSVDAPGYASVPVEKFFYTLNDEIIPYANQEDFNGSTQAFWIENGVPKATIFYFQGE